MIEQFFLFYQTRATFDSELEAGQISNTYHIAFIKDTREIWTHGQFYPCNISDSQFEELTTTVETALSAIKDSVGLGENYEFTSTVDGLTDKTSIKDAIESLAKDLAQVVVPGSGSEGEGGEPATPEVADFIKNYITQEINNFANIVNAYTINGKAISENPVLGGADIVLTDYVSEAETPIILDTDTTNAAIAKLEKNLTTVQEIVNKNYLTVAISSNVTIFEKNVSTNPVLTLSIKFDGEVVEPDTLDLKKNSSSVSTDNTATSYTDAEGITDDTTYQLDVTYQGASKSASVTVRSYYAMYFGFSQKSADLIESDITSFTKQAIKSNAAGSYTLTGAVLNDYAWFCVPTEFAINRMTSSGFDVPLEQPVTVSVAGHDYKCYRTSSALAAGDMSVVIS